MKNFNRGFPLGFLFRLLVLLGFALFLGIPWDAFGEVTFTPGTFQGVLRSDSNNDESFGFITIALTASGKFSMRFNLGVNRIGRHFYAKTGTFDQNGSYHFEGPPVTDTRYAIARIIDLRLTSPNSIEGEVTDLTHSSTIELERVAIFSAANPAQEAGRYTFLISSAEPGLPSGFGYGTAIVSSSGRISMSGRSADEMPFTQSASLTGNGLWPVFAKLGGSTKGIFCGWIVFRNLTQSDFQGALTWLGPEVPGPNNAFVPKFSGDLLMTGSRYVAPRGTTVLQTASSTNNLQLTLSSGGLEMPIDRDLTISSRNRITFSDKRLGDAMSINVGNGTFIGGFLHPDGNRDIFRGAILQKQNRGGGHFMDRSEQAGKVELQPQ